MSPKDKHNKAFKSSDRIKRLFGLTDKPYWATVIRVGPHTIQVLWDNGEIEVLDEWDCQDLEVVE